MHEFVARRDGFRRARLLATSEGGPQATVDAVSPDTSDAPDTSDGPDASGAPEALLFHVEGADPAREAYAAALRDAEGVTDFELDRREGVLYAYVLENRSPFDGRLAATFARLHLVVVPPVDFVADRSIRLTVIGRADAVQSAVESVPPGVEHEVRRVGGFDATAVDPSLSAGLTARQREAVAAAVDVGYYGATRERGVDAVAAALGCSTGTAAEHLRKAEARVMRAVVGR
jgi:predicted DNA binding protein